MMPPPTPPLYAAGMKTTLSVPHVALVDDDLDVRVGLQALLRSFGYRVSLYEDAQAFLDAKAGDVDCAWMVLRCWRACVRAGIRRRAS
jgi:DNA-binding response OmpR family regulator